jgi:hypothetical protein
MHHTLRRTRTHNVTPHRLSLRAEGGLRAIFGVMAVATILTAVVACDKRAQGEPVDPAPRRQTSLAGKPTVLFQLFGDPADPRLLPVAVMGHGRLSPIILDGSGWRTFDKLYFKPGARMAVYHDGSPLTVAVVQRGMWTGGTPLYRLPGCRAPRPMAAVKLDSVPEEMTSLDLIGTSDSVPLATRPALTTADLDSARAFAERVAKRAALLPAARSEMDLNVRAMHTGTSGMPTLLATFMEKPAAFGLRPRQVFALGDSAAAGYDVTFYHAPRDSTPEFRRMVDHLDFTGDGVDEVVLEGWKTGGDSYPIVLKYTNGRWHELARGAGTWCADPPRRESPLHVRVPGVN